MKEFFTSKETERNLRLLTLELTVLNHNQDKGELQTPTNNAKIPHNAFVECFSFSEKHLYER